MGGGTRAAILWKKGGEARMSHPPKSKGPAARSAFACPPLIFSPRLQLLWADPAAQALVPGLCGQGGALELLRAHPGAWELLRAGRGVSLLLPGPGDLLFEEEALAGRMKKAPPGPGLGPPPVGRRALSLRRARLSPCEQVPLEEALGRVAARPVSHCPPGVPLVCPGEEIDEQIKNFCAKCGVFFLPVVK